MVATVAVVGAGPKGISLAAKARALAEAGLDAPRVVLIDRHGVAESWSGRQGYTNGMLRLGTPPEKDVGFPYAQSWGAASAAVGAAMARYSWQAYLIDRGVYSDWVDRGRMHPTHREWSGYLRSVAEKTGTEVVQKEAVALDVEGERWLCRLDGGQVVAADGLVLTGSGPPITVPGQPAEHPRILDGRSYWLDQTRLWKQHGLNICVIGSGETAASVVVGVLNKLHKGSTVEVLTSRGVLYSRGESFDENRFYSDPGDWPRLAESHRREFLERTDRGVFSLQAEAALTRSRAFRTLAGRAVRIDADDCHVIVTIEYGREREHVAYDFVVVAIGFQPRWFESLLTPEANQRLARAVGDDDLEGRIGVDLSVEGLRPRLHLPMLAGLAQGPGFPNLSSLGLMSDRVLRPYVDSRGPVRSAVPNPEVRELV
jgi:mycobactin lysine-N-oxygenase